MLNSMGDLSCLSRYCRGRPVNVVIMVFQLFPCRLCLFTSGVLSVTTDESFSVPSPANKKALETASSLVHWSDCPENYEHLLMFSRILCIRLRACFCRKYTSLRLRKERMWQAYHRLRTAVSFCTNWK